MNSFKKKATRPLIAGLMGICLMSGSALAADYYRWVGEDGVTHYGSMPPIGVKAEKMKSSGGSGSSTQTQGSDNEKNTAVTSNPEISAERKQELLAERQAQCTQEKDRLKTLTAKGSKIRMQDEKGNARYLNAEELAKEVSMSEKFIREACK